MTIPTLMIDTRQKSGKHEAKHGWFASQGIHCVRSKLYVGDYMLVGGTVSCDSKRDIFELAQDIDQQHQRFKTELINARDAGISLVVLTENDHGVRSLDDLARWRESDAEMRRRRNAKRRIEGARLAKACSTMQERYGARFEFCAPDESAWRIVEILTTEGREHG